MPTSFVKWAQKLYFCSGKVLFGEVYLFNLKSSSIEIFQRAGTGGKGEGQPVGIKGLDFPVKALIQLAVFAVTQQRMPRMGKLGTDLVGPAGNQLTFHQA